MLNFIFAGEDRLLTGWVISNGTLKDLDGTMKKRIWTISAKIERGHFRENISQTQHL